LTSNPIEWVFPCENSETPLAKDNRWHMIDADGLVGMNRQPGIRIELCTLTKATLPRPSA